MSGPDGDPSEAIGSDTASPPAYTYTARPPEDGQSRLRLFISSPGDLAEERLVCQEVIHELTPEFLHLAVLEPILWEELPLTAEQAFQDQLPLPAECQVVILMLWSRLGSRLHSRYKELGDSEPPTGTLFEFRNALARRQQTQRLPDILVYRKLAPPPVPSLTDEEAWQRARQNLREVDQFFETNFRDAAAGAFVGAFHTFHGPLEFRGKLKEHLRRVIREQLSKAVGQGCSIIQWPWLISERGSPFRGLKTFEAEHASVFFGRTEAAAAVRRTLMTQAAAGRSFVLVTGASGLGKSSLARAGVIPKLIEPGTVPGISFWRTAVLGPKLGSIAGPDSLGGSDSGSDPLLFQLAHALIGALPAIAGGRPDLPGFAVELARSWSEQPALARAKVETGLVAVATEARLREQAKLEKKVTELEAAGAYDQAKELRSQAGRILEPQGRVVLLVDQLEETFTAANITQASRERFVAVLDSLARSELVWIIATLRSDFIGRLVELPVLVRLIQGGGEYRLLPPTREELGQMIRAPALSAGLRFEIRSRTRTGLDDLLRDEALDDPMALPLLEFALEELFHRREPLPDGGGRLTIRAYAQIRKLRGAIGRQAERVYISSETAQREAFSHVMRGIVTLNFTEDGEATVTRRWSRYDHLTATPGGKALVDAFIGARLFIADQEANPSSDSAATVSVAHEALFNGWPRLKRWLVSEREFLKARARLENDLRRWQEERQSDGYLLDGKRMADATALLEEHRADLTAEQVDYIRRSQASAELAVKRRVRRLQAALALFAVLTVGGAALAWLAWNAQQRATTEAARAIRARNQAEKLVQFMLFDLREKLEPVGKLDLMSGISDRVENYYQAFSEEAPDSQTLRNQATALDSIGNVRVAEGNLSGALDAYQKGFDIWQRLTSNEPTNTAWQRGLSTAWQKLGDIRVVNGDLAGALQMYQQALEISQRLVQQASNDPDLQRDLLVNWDKIGLVYFRQSNVTRASEAFRKAIEIAEQLTKRDDKNNTWQRDLAGAWEKMGLLLASQGELSGALEAHEKQLMICQKLVQREPNNSNFQRDVAVAWLHVGETKDDLSDLAGALAAFQKRLEITQRLTERDPGNSEWQRDLAVARDNIADVHYEKKEYVEAQAAYESELSIYQELGKRDPSNTEWQRDLALAWDDIGYVRQDQNDFAGALAAFQKSFEIKQRLVQHDPINADWQRDLTISWNLIGDLRFKQNDFTGALDAFQNGLKIRLQHAVNSIEAEADIAASELFVGKALVALGRKEEGRAKLEDARQLLYTIKGKAQLTAIQKEHLTQIESELAKLDKLDKR